MSNDTIRAAFEAWASDQGHVLDRLDMGGEPAYADLRTEGAWWAWRAALAAPAPQPAADPIKTISRKLDVYLAAYDDMQDADDLAATRQAREELLAEIERAIAAPAPQPEQSEWPTKPLDLVQVVLPDGFTQAMCRPVFACFDAHALSELERRFTSSSVTDRDWALRLADHIDALLTEHGSAGYGGETDVHANARAEVSEFRAAHGIPPEGKQP